jgi:hypothetical protein
MGRSTEVERLSQELAEHKLFHDLAMKELEAEVERLKKLASEQDRMLGARPCQYDRCIHYRVLRREVHTWRDHFTELTFHPTTGTLVLK